MKIGTVLIASLIAFLFAALTPLQAAPGKDLPHDPLEGAFFPPELVMLAGERIGLTQKQRETLQARIEKTQPRFDELRQRLERESAALAALAKQERVDEAALLAQLDKVLDAEREVKRLHIALVAAIKNILTSDQQSKLREFAKGGGTDLAAEIRQRLAEKIERVQAGARKWAESGRDPAEIGRAMEEKFKPLIEAGKVREAEAELDRILERVENAK